jgi:hypothetical protein
MDTLTNPNSSIAKAGSETVGTRMKMRLLKGGHVIVFIVYQKHDVNSTVQLRPQLQSRVTEGHSCLRFFTPFASD